MARARFQRYPETHGEHIDCCVASVEAKLAADAAREASQGVACSICYEVVIDKTDYSGAARFGKRSNHRHVLPLVTIVVRI